MQWLQHDGLMLFGQLGFVPPSWWGCGIGRALLAWLERRQRDGFRAVRRNATWRKTLDLGA